MDIKDIPSQKETFKKYTDNYINNALDESIKERHIIKQNHSYEVLEETMLIDALFTDYNPSFKNLLALESLFHDIGRFEQLKVTGTFADIDINKHYNNMIDHGDLGAKIIEEHGLLKELIPNVRIYDEEVKRVIRAHSKMNPEILNMILKNYIDIIRNYDLKELFMSNNSNMEKEVLSATNTAIIQDADRIDIFRQIVKGIWIPLVTNDKIDPDIFELYKKGKLPTINEIKKMGKWNANVGHLVRLSFINQMNLVPVLEQIRDEKIIDRLYDKSGNSIVEPAYEFAKKELDNIINNSDDVVVRRH